MNYVIGVNNPYGLIQKAGKKKQRTFRKRRNIGRKTRKQRKQRKQRK